ncbi:hypothetical protein OG982_06100 [Streptomyces sp. NBC_01551]|uniref:hypothetical protein n=1 Tax=Streptomyces sp. NBC_01551 TaxID=2975876 RepID=UPI002259A60F|nr:hypothetical protein [Streptomyces sp. NBC_01551]MCX4525265.1 hypothetical protein [Streptomyces sp. NBC_01551]
MTRRLLARLARLERVVASTRPPYDSAEERRRYGEPVAPGSDSGPHRTYARQAGTEFTLTAITPAGAVTYVLPGVDGTALT